MSGRFFTAKTACFSHSFKRLAFRQTNTLTIGIDPAADFTGGAGPDTFVANKADGTNHFTSLDVLDGGAGLDTLTGQFTASFDSATAVGASVSNIETVVFSTTNDMTVNTTAWAGVTSLTLTSVNAMVATAAVTTDIVAATTNLDTASTINGGKNVTFTSAEAATLGGGTTSSAITVGATTAAKGAVVITHTETYTDDSTAGAVDTGAGSTISVTGGTTVTINSLAVLGTQNGAGDDVATTGAISVTGTADTTAVTVTQSAAVNTAATAGLSVDHANGAVTIADATAATGIADTITSVTLANYGNSTITSSALTTLNITGGTVASGTLGIATQSATGGATTLNLNAAGGSVGAITGTQMDDYTTVNINSSSATTIGGIEADLMATLNFTGAAATTISTMTAAQNAALVDINVTGAGGVTIGSAIGAAVDFDGGAGNDSVSLGATTQGITMGAGDDTVTYGGAAGTGGSVAAGEGTDTIVMTDAQAAAADGSATFNSTFTGFEKLNISDAFVEDALDVSLLNNVPTVVLASGVSGTAAINNMQTGGTVQINADGASTPALTINVLGASGNGSDTFTLKLEGTDIAAGTVTLASVENISIDMSDPTTAIAADAGSIALVATSATSISLSGNNGLAMGTLNAGMTAITSFNASGIVANDTATTTDTAAELAVSATFAALAAASTITGGAGNDTLNAAAAVAAVTMVGGAGIDALTGSATKASNISGGAGDDTITGGAAADVIDGGAGTDTFVFSSANVVEQVGGSTTTGAVINLGATALTGGAVNTATGAFVAQGTSVASNTATYLFSADDSTNVSVVDTLTAIENVTGTNLADYIVGSATANVITGGAGNDILTGGAGSDTFVFSGVTAAANGADTITDFVVGLDKLDIGVLANATTGTAITLATATALATEGTSIGVADGKSLFAIVANIADVNTAAKVATALTDAGVLDAVDFVASKTGYLVLGAADNATTLYVYGVTMDATAGFSTGDSVALLATITTDSTTLTTDNFI